MTDEYPAATCPKCQGKIGHPGHCPNCSSHTGDSIQRAIEIAVDIHKGQYRKGGCKPPYIVHCFAVLNKMLRWGITDSQLLTATPLHDGIEDGDDKHKVVVAIDEQCGPVVAAYVWEMTCLPTDDKQTYMESFKTKSCGALLMKLADRLCNVEDFYHNKETKEYAKKYFRKADPLFTAFVNRKDECIEKYGEEVWTAAWLELKQTALLFNPTWQGMATDDTNHTIKE